MASVVRENIGLLNDKLVIKLTTHDYLPTFEKKVKEYSKKANIPGFRKGMVPVGMIKKMYGPSIFNEEVLRTVEQELFTYLDTERPDIFARPLPLASELVNLDMNKPGDYEFGFEIGLKPEFAIPELSIGKFTLHTISVSDSLVEDELNRLRIKAGNMTDREVVDNEENVLNIKLTECDQKGIPVENGIVKENSLLVKYLAPSMQKQVMGKKFGDSMVFSLDKTFEGDKLDMMLQDLGFEKGDKEAAAKFFKMDIVKIGHVEKREMEPSFFNELFPGRDITTEEACRNALREEMEKYWEGQSRNQLHDQIYHFLLDETKMEFPEQFLKRWLQVGTEKEKTAEQAEQEFPSFSNQLKWTLISDKILRDNKLDVTNEEIRQHMKNEVMGYFGQSMPGIELDWLDGYVDRMMKDEKHVDNTYRRLISEKMFVWAEGQVKPKKKAVTTDELNAMQHHH